MMAGRMKERLRLMKPVRSVGRFGDENIEFQEYAVVHAERVKMSGSRREEASEHFADYRAEFNIRDAHPARVHWRAEQDGGELYEVVAVIRNRDRGMLTLVCERVNE